MGRVRDSMPVARRSWMALSVMARRSGWTSSRVLAVMVSSWCWRRPEAVGGIVSSVDAESGG